MDMNLKSGRVQTCTIQAVIFDLDGVLMNSEVVAFKVWQELAERHGGTLDESAFQGMIGISAEETAEYVMRHAHVVFDVTEGCAWAWQRVIERLRDEIEPLPGSTELVRQLAECGCKLAVASNSLAYYIDICLESIGLAEYFPVRVAIDQVAQGKPAPDVYLRAAQLLSVPPGRCLAIEDSRVGVQAAASAGMRVLAVPGPHDHKNGFDQAWRMYHSLEQVKENLADVLR
jgi:HAD superfamily hydrolase (TIGR01509 family)